MMLANLEKNIFNELNNWISKVKISHVRRSISRLLGIAVMDSSCQSDGQLIFVKYMMRTLVQ